MLKYLDLNGKEMSYMYNENVRGKGQAIFESFRYWNDIDNGFSDQVGSIVFYRDRQPNLLAFRCGRNQTKNDKIEIERLFEKNKLALKDFFKLDDDTKMEINFMSSFVVIDGIRIKAYVEIRNNHSLVIYLDNFDLVKNKFLQKEFDELINGSLIDFRSTKIEIMDGKHSIVQYFDPNRIFT